MGTQRTISYRRIKELASHGAGSGSSTIPFDSSTSKTVEVWVKVTAKSGTLPTLDVTVDAQLDSAIGWTGQKAFPQINAVGVYAIALNRASHALGKELQISWVVAGALTPNFTFEAFAGRYE